MDRALRWQILGQGAPLAAGRQDVEEPVQHLAHVHRAPTAAALGRRDEGLDQRPLGVGQVARVAQPTALVSLPLFRGPHRAPPPCPASTAKPLPRFTNLPDGLKHSATTSTSDDGFRRIEVITGVGRRRRWTDEEKAWIVAESLYPATTTSAVAVAMGCTRASCSSVCVVDRRARAHGLGPDQGPRARAAAAMGLEDRAARGHCRGLTVVRQTTLTVRRWYGPAEAWAALVLAGGPILDRLSRRSSPRRPDHTHKPPRAYRPDWHWGWRSDP